MVYTYPHIILMKMQIQFVSYRANKQTDTQTNDGQGITFTYCHKLRE